jgi:hypothetical protein
MPGKLAPMGGTAMKRKPGNMSFLQHEALGKSLYDTRNDLQEKGLDLANNHYGKRAKEVELLFKIVDSIDKLRDLMDERVFSEYKERDTNALVKVYYPGTGRS